MERSTCEATVKYFYEAVINNVISRVQEKFIEEGIDEEVLEELKQTWEAKLKASQSANKNNANLNTNSEHQVQETKEEMKIKKVPLQIILPSQSDDSNIEQRIVTIQVPPSVTEVNYIYNVLSGALINATMSLPIPIATVVLQQHVDAALMSLQHASGTVNKPSIIGSNNNQSQTQSALSEIRSQPSTSGMMVSCKSHSADLPDSEEDE